MAATYDPAGHALLNDDAADLGAAALQGWADAAERTLGLKGAAFTGEDAETAKLAVVYWINCQMTNRNGRLTAKSKGSQSESYSESAGENDCDRAWSLIAQLGLPGRHGSYEAAGGLR